MSEFSLEVQSGNSIRLLTEGKYCDRDIIVSSPEIEKGYAITKIASDYECVRAVTTIDIKSYDWWKSVTANDIYYVTKGVKATTAGTFPRNAVCSPIISYSNGVISLNRSAIDGSLVVTFIMDIWVAHKTA